jgi:DNA primase
MATAFVDFTTLKQTVNIQQVVQMLGLKMTGGNMQMRGECPSCRSGGSRALAISLEKQSFYCFAEKKGGDQIALCAHIMGKSPRDAAQHIATHFRFAGANDNSPAPAQPPQALQKRPSFDADAYLRTLDPAAGQLSELGLLPETLTGWRAGYCKAGVNRGKLAIALCDREATILGFCGWSLDGSTPRLTFPNSVNPRDIVFGQDKITGEEVRLLRDPLEVLLAAEMGESAVCFLTDEIDPQQLEVLASLLDQKKAKVFF